MKAVRLYAPGDLRVEEVELPEIKADEVLVKVMVVGVCGSDIPRINEYGAHNAPLTMGHEFSGKILKIGLDVEGWNEGDRITAGPLIPCHKCEWCEKSRYSLCEDYSYLGSRQDGAMADYVAVPANNLVKVPDNVSYSAAAMTDPAANAIHGLWKGDVKGKKIIILGVGPIGLFAIQYARYLGADTIIAIDISDKKLEIALELGATHVINNLRESNSEEKIKEITNTKMADFILETAGSKITQNQALHLIAPNGRVVYLGISHDELMLDEQSVENILRGEVEIVGSWNSFSDPFPGKEWFEAIKCFKEGEFISDPLISQKLSLDKAPEIFSKIRNDKDFFYNKILFTPGLEE
ncbi:alcohol dehydrogenase catalytic domain-containing protein [Iocasia frigidifontis]|uniref:Alcohol dehydrogenase catalytic domain-containing protein n=1 Tax=Iocasia fonsfrigidae TaxID=2682810 RepID=A0A8A7KEJ2_9FIRM|nr:galactitol-1-phosphate 5-dehydrogenase [Iocasia fonsfrigidae]QTL96594.1 alcohol dehydrogenase catalytic domain-containing protein [Iocasia fonsfrigidae]